MTSPIDTTAEAIPAVPPAPAPKHAPTFVRGSTQATINALREERDRLSWQHEEGAKAILALQARIRELEGCLRDVCAPAIRAARVLEGER